MDETTWRRRTGPTLLVASIAFLLAYSWRVITEADGPWAMVADTVVVVTWAMFVIDYVVRLSLAPEKWRWFRTHLADLAITLVPVLRLVRVARVFTHLPGMRRTRAAALRTRILVYGIASTAILIFIASLQVLDRERGAPGATIVSFGDALWWACVTATTTGFGDLTPVTVIGRLVGVILMFGGVALAGVITATLASWVFERGAHGDGADAATKDDVRALRDEIAALREDLAQGGGKPHGSDPIQ
ncbi:MULTISPECIES: potassium channel family protein [unclassified Microbacterium]|uniref:potassium channel family protein n=1 Tax=unclassified Microbacterium TaxID=2609290 RepID=UPI0012FA400A|nr:potassium channel family protein [Microbacterium sp. MAH-37]MVQ43819.1 two pore domain potassium channel family protein [Microbacterium sp. MAH-37]